MSLVNDLERVTDRRSLIPEEERWAVVRRAKEALAQIERYATSPTSGTTQGDYAERKIKEQLRDTLAR